MSAEGKHYRFEDIEFWAEDGVIFIEDHIDSTYKAVTCSDFRDRAIAVKRAVDREYQRGMYPDEHKRLVDCLCDMRDCFKEAKAQGDPADPSVAIQRYRDRKKSILISGSKDANGSGVKKLIVGEI